MWLANSPAKERQNMTYPELDDDDREELWEGVRALNAADEQYFQLRRKHELLSAEEEETERAFDIILGQSDELELSPAEGEILADHSLTLIERANRINALRSSKQPKPRPFDEHVANEDRVRAHGMGIKLD
jgi:hypothetical protein